MIALVVAASNEGVIGFEGKMPWHIAEDLHHFRDLTMGHTVVMGRRTFESIGHPLPGRRNIVLTRGRSKEGEGRSGDSLELCSDLDSILHSRPTPPPSAHAERHPECQRTEPAAWASPPAARWLSAALDAAPQATWRGRRATQRCQHLAREVTIPSEAVFGCHAEPTDRSARHLGDTAKPHSTLFIIGGGEIYAQAMPFADRIYLTLVHGTWPGDTFFPPIDPAQWLLVDRQPHLYAPTPFEYLIFDRIRS